MDDSNQQPHGYGGGQQRSQHSRPFFYVQPPSQPYYVYQHWQLNHPYSHYGLPGAFNYSRPYIHPYQYMQYPGFMFPHAPLYPVDYRRMFEPRFHPPTWGQQHHPQPQGRREMACSEAQTDPNDAISKLIECLDKIRTNELRHGAERELDSGVASHSSGMFSPVEERKGDEQGHVLPSLPGNLASPAVVFSDSTTAVYDESSHRSLDTMSPEGCWSGALEEELPLDSSSVHEERVQVAQTAGDEAFISYGAVEVAVQSDIVAPELKAPKCQAEELKPFHLTPFFSSDQPVAKEGKITDPSKTHCPGVSSDQEPPDPSCRILRLPFESILTPKVSGGDPLSSASPYFYNYLSVQTTHERMSVLSPSLDELSSREEMFSTDLDDVDLFPKTVYTSGQRRPPRLAEASAASPRTTEEAEEVWLPSSKRGVTCACCGKTLLKGSGRSKVQTSAAYKDEAGDSEEESRYRRGREQPLRVVVRKHVSPRKHPPPPLRPPGKPWYKRGQYREASDLCGQEDAHELCKKNPDDGEVAEETSGELQCRTCQDGLCREELTSGDQTRWGEVSAFPRRRQTTPVKRQEMSAQRKVMYHRPREDDNDEDEPLPLHWDRGSSIREPRC